MTELDISLSGETIRINGYPEAVALKDICIDTDAQRLRDLTLHYSDLNFSFHVLVKLVRDGGDMDELTTTALWNSSIARFFKCFQRSKSRVKLNFNEVFAGQPPMAETVYEHFRRFVTNIWFMMKIPIRRHLLD